jgi:FkbM family methyltransferase
MRTIFPDADEERLKSEFFGAGAGFFVDVGANHPQHGSQSWPLEQRGWSGVVVEPQPHLAEKLRELRKARVFEVVCSSPRNAGKTFPFYLADMHSSLNPQLVTTSRAPHGTVDVLARTLDDILAEAGAPRQIDFVSIDVEGHELDVLAGLDLRRWRCRLILLEDHVTSLAAHRFLVRQNYSLIRRTGLNGWYVPAEDAPSLSIGGRWSLMRKYYLGLPVRRLREYKRRLRSRIRMPAQRSADDVNAHAGR